MNFDLRYPFSQILSKPGLSGTSHVGAGSEQGGKSSVSVSYMLQTVKKKKCAVALHLPKPWK